MVSIREIIVEGRKWEGEVLQGELFSHGSVRHLPHESLVLVEVMDFEGSIISLLVARVALSDTPVAEIESMYPHGALVSLHNQGEAGVRLSSENATCPYLLVKNPSVLQVRSFLSEKAMEICHCMDAAQLRKQGNLEFSKKHFQAAAQLYGMSYAKAQPSELDFLLALANRAECYLKMGLWKEAEADCEEALRLHQRHDKTLFRLGRALHQMQEYEEACIALSKAAELNTTDASIRAALAKSQVFLVQSTTGAYGDFLEHFIMTGSNPDAAPDCSEYIGPVEIQMTTDGRGRGLFATKDIKVGALVIVSKAIAFAGRKGEDCTETSYDLNEQALTTLVNTCMKSKEHLRQIYMLHDSAGGSTDVPPMCFFGPGKRKRAVSMNLQGHDQDDLLIDVERIERIFYSTSYAFGAHKNGWDASNVLFVGLWVIPSFLNHSCFPNLIKIEVGDAAFFHACRDIKAGDELCVDYFEMCLPWGYRRKQLQENYGFECYCRRCTTEAKYDGQLKHAANCLVALQVNKTKLEGDRNIPDLPQLASCAFEVEKAIEDADEDEKSCVRTAYILAYLKYYELKKQGAAVPAGLLPSPQVLADALRFCAPGKLEAILHIGSLCGQLDASDLWVLTGRDSGYPHVVMELNRQVGDCTWSWLKKAKLKPW